MDLWRIIFTAGCAALIGVSTASAAANRIVAISNVCVVPMSARGGQTCGQTVLIEGARIAEIGPAGKVKPGRGAIRIDGRGKWLMPGLADMHVHVENDRLVRLLLGDERIGSAAIDPADILLPYVANGVLQVANLAAMSESLAQRDLIESGKVLGPHMATAAMVDGANPIWPLGMSREAASPESGRRAVQDIRSEGFDFVKVYSKLSADTYEAILQQAATERMKVVGHIPGRGAGKTETFLRPGGLSMVAHAEEFAYQVGESEAAIPELARLAAANGIWLTPTLTLDMRILEQAENAKALEGRPELAYVHPLTRRFWRERNSYLGNAGLAGHVRRVSAFNSKLVRAFAEAGVPIVAGTDSLVPGVVPGFALHDELEALQAAGVSPERVLAGATRLSAEWLGVAPDRGTVEVGKRADLILLTADPLVDVSNTRRIAYVLRDGRPYSRSDLDKRMAALAARYASGAD
jgi:hypothetical protein